MKVFLLSFCFTPQSMKHLHTPPKSEEPSKSARCYKTNHIPKPEEPLRDLVDDMRERGGLTRICAGLQLID